MSFGREYNSHNDHWIFVRDRDIDRTNVNRFYVNRIDHDRIIRNSRVIENTYFDSRRNIKYISGPAREDVQKATGRRVNPVTILENNKPGQNLRNGQLSIYRPAVIKNNDREQRPAPSRITNMQDLKRPAERNRTNQRVNTNPQNNTRSEGQQNRVNQQNSNNNTKAVKQQNANPTNNTRREGQQNTVNPQNNNSTKAVKQQDAKPTQNTRRVRQPANVKPSDKKQTVQPKKSKSEQDIKKKD
jgi:hypothetical protein